MDKILFNILDSVNEGIIILNDNMQILAWNSYMELIISINRDKVRMSSIYDIFPNFNKDYFKKSMKYVMENGCDMFFSAAMHKNLISTKRKFNLKISLMKDDHNRLLMLEFVDVTNQFERIEQLRGCIDKLYVLNKKLKEKEEIIKDLAYYDNLTGAANRALFYKTADKLLDSVKEDNQLLALMFIDIDKFKNINDTYGHKKGDEILVKVADALKKSTRKNDVVARFGGDEFLVLLPYIKRTNNYKAVVSRIIHTKNKLINIGNNDMYVSLSIGVSFYPFDGENINELILKADKAMYAAKSLGKDDNYLCSACNL